MKKEVCQYCKHCKKMWQGSVVGRFCLLFLSKRTSTGYRRVFGRMDACVKYEQAEGENIRFWSDDDKKTLEEMKNKGCDWSEIALLLGRTRDAVRTYYYYNKSKKNNQ